MNLAKFECSKCGTIVNVKDSFCSNCGNINKNSIETKILRNSRFKNVTISMVLMGIILVPVSFIMLFLIA
jgi:uncharacterized OB-fold protein